MSPPKRFFIKSLASLLLFSFLFNFLVTPILAATFTPGMAKRNAPGPFTAAPVVQGKLTVDTDTGDFFGTTWQQPSQISGNFYDLWDSDQGHIGFWVTPEWNGNDGKTHTFVESAAGPLISKRTNNYLSFYDTGIGAHVSIVDISLWIAGTTYRVDVRWDSKNTLDGTNHICISVDDVHTFTRTSGWTPNIASRVTIGSHGTGGNPADALIEGLTIYRRPLYDGDDDDGGDRANCCGIDAGNGDEINQIWAAGAGKDPTLVTGSWDVVFALPTNSSTGTLTSGSGVTGEAWTHPHSSNLLYTDTTNTGGFMMNGTYGSDGWEATGALTPTNGTESSLSFDGADTVNAVGLVNDIDSGDYTLSTWFKPSINIVPDSGTARIMFIMQGAANDIWLMFSSVSGRFGLIQWNGSGWEFAQSTQTSWSAGQWYHFAGVYEEGAEKELKLYINGELSGSNPTGARAEGPATRANIGSCANAGNCGPGYGGFLGTIEDFKAFNRAASQQEIKDTMYKGSLTAQELDGLVGWWKFDEGTGQTVADSSGTGNNGTLGANSDPGSDDPTWSTDTPVPTISALATTDKIYAGGYKYTSSNANEGIYQDITVAAGADVVIRGLAHSDGTSIPKLILYDQTGSGREIGSLTGTNITGTHTGDNGAAVLTDSSKSWTGDQWIGYTVLNTTDGSSATITANDATTITATLAGGTDNNWDTDNAYRIASNRTQPDVFIFTGEANPTDSGTHTGDNDAAVLTDSSKSWSTNYWVGHTVTNTTDGSSGEITANTATTITATLAGGTDKNWDTNDAYTINGTTTIRVKLVNTAASGVTYWHQVEVLGNTFTNPSLETGSGDPWIPTGWTSGNLQAGESVQETSDVHSGGSAGEFNYSGSYSNREWYPGLPSLTVSKFYSLGAWLKSGPLFPFYASCLNYRTQHLSPCSVDSSNAPFGNNVNPADWTFYGAIYRADRTPATRINFGFLGSSSTGMVDDVYRFELDDVTLTVTPASQENSTENTDEIRVDGRDAYVESSASSLSTTTGYFSFDWRPRHSAADSVKWAEDSSEDAYIVSCFSSYPSNYDSGRHSGLNNQSVMTDPLKSWTADEWVGYTIYNTTDGSSGTITANTTTTVTASLSGGSENNWDNWDNYEIKLADEDDYIKVWWDSANTVKMAYNMNGAGEVVSDPGWDATGLIDAGSQYAVVVQYTGGSTMTLSVGGTTRITLSSIPAVFGSAPNNVYFGSSYQSTDQGDTTFSELTFDNTAPSISLTALSPDPNSDTTPSVTGTATEASGTVASVEYQMEGTGGSWTACSADVGTFDEASEAFTCNVGTALSDGSHTIYVRATDSNGNTTGSGSEETDTFTIDATSPTSGSISINSGDATTTSRSVTLALSATDAGSGLAQMILSESSNFSGASWQSYATSKSFTLSSSEGTKTVYVKFKDEAGNKSTSSSDTIIYDASSPSSFELLSPEDHSYTSDQTPTFKWEKTTDSASNLSEYQIIVDGEVLIDNINPDQPDDGNYREDDTKYTRYGDDDIKVYAKDGSKELEEGEHGWKVRAIDEADNFTDSDERALNIDTTSPTVEALTLDDTLLTTRIITTTDRTPTISGRVLDSLDSAEDNTKIASGPKGIEIKISEKNLLGLYELKTLVSLNLSQSYWSSDGSEIRDNSQNTSDKYSPFSYTLTSALSYGDYQITLTGEDQAENKEDKTIIYLAIAPLEEVVTPEELEIIEEEIEELIPEEVSPEERERLRKEAKEALEIVREVEPQEPSLAQKIITNLSSTIRDLYWQGIGSAGLVLRIFGQAVLDATRVLTSSLLNLAKTSGEATLKISTDTAEMLRNILTQASEVTFQSLASLGNAVIKQATFSTAAISQSYHQLALSAPRIVSKSMLALEGGASQLATAIEGAITPSANYFRNSLLSIKEDIGTSWSGPALSLIDTRRYVASAPSSVQDKATKVARTSGAGISQGVRNISERASTTLSRTQKFIADISAPIRNGVGGAGTDIKINLVRTATIWFSKEPTRILAVYIEEVGKDYAIVSWETSHYTINNAVNYGEDLSYGQKVSASGKEKYHVTRLENLKFGTRYFFEVMSQNKNYVYDAYYSFETLSP